MKWIFLYTVCENIIAATKIRNNYGAIQSFIFQYCDRNIGLVKLSLLTSLHLFWYQFFAPFLMALSLKLSLLKAIAKRLPLLFANALKSVKERQAIQKKKP